MATLQSPGINVSVVDESFYTPAAPGTVPMIFVASATDKLNASGTSIALGTTDENVGKVWTITSQRDLVDTFGTPKFYTDLNGNPINGSEQNEYGLQAAYSYLGVSSRVFVARADVNLADLSASSSEPVGLPVSGTYWIDTNASRYGIHEWDLTNSTFVYKLPLVVNNDNLTSIGNVDGTAPVDTIGAEGDYAVVVTSDNTNSVWYKAASEWVKVGSAEWKNALPVSVTGSVVTLLDRDFNIRVNGIDINIVRQEADISQETVIGEFATAFQEQSERVTASFVNNKLTLSCPGDIVIEQVDSEVDLPVGFVAGVTYGRKFVAQPHTQIPQFGLIPSKSVYLKTTSPALGALWNVQYFNGATMQWDQVTAALYPSKAAAMQQLDSAGGKNLPVGQVFVKYSVLAADLTVYRRAVAGATVISAVPSVSELVEDVFAVSISATQPGSAAYSEPVTISFNTAITVNEFANLVRGAGVLNVTAEFNQSTGILNIRHTAGGDIKFEAVPDTTNPLAVLGFTAYDPVQLTGTANLYSEEGNLVASGWKELVYEAKDSAPVTAPADGKLWYSSIVDQVDIMYHNGTNWVGYRDSTAFPLTDPNGPLVRAVAPTKQSTGANLQTGDIWVDTSDIAQYGHNIYVWNQSKAKWIKQDTTDQVTPSGWVFADARWATAGSETAPSKIKSLLTSNYVDPDAPDPALYPQGIRLWNLRRSGFNVKKYVVNHIDLTANSGVNIRYTVGTGNDAHFEALDGYSTARWVTVSPNQPTGAGSFGTIAQRGFVVASLKKLIDTNERIRDTDTVVYNLIACPGYPEAIANMIALNVDRKQTALVIGDTPFTLQPNGTALSEWGNNVNNAFDNGVDGAVSNDEFMAMFYPSGYTTDNTGNYIVVPPSHMILRTIANSDAKSYPWFAPAGTRRGAVDNATSVGYLLDGEFKPTPLRDGIRDVLYTDARINPIATFPGVGIVNYGQKTRAKNASALDRINVVRLVAYLRRQLDILARPYLFEPNDQSTRNEIKAAVESLLLELVTLRAIYDFVVVCDESNNTPARVDRNELWLDLAIEPTKAIEFIYIPLRIKNTGDIAAGL